jgi:hypothetical protein
MQRATANVAIALSLGLGLALVCLWVLVGGASLVQAQGPDGYSVYHVAPACAGVPDPCYTSVQAAVDAADDPDDVIKVAAGIYTGVNVRSRNDITSTGLVTQVVYISKSVAIKGGYTLAFTEPPDPEANLTTLDAQGQGRVLYITGDISSTIEGLRITGGDAGGLSGGLWYGIETGDDGGGVYIISATVTLGNDRVFGNTAEEGGGMFLSQADVTLSHNSIFSNTASTWDGGGLDLWYSDVLLSDNIIAANSAADSGGGLGLDNSDARLRGNSVVSNTAGVGGGLRSNFGEAILSDNTVSANAAEYDGGLFLQTFSATLVGNIVAFDMATGTTATPNPRSGGGLFLLDGPATLSSNTFIANVADYGGGLYLWDSNAKLEGNTVISNAAELCGGGLHLESSPASLEGNTIVSNTVRWYGGGLCLSFSSAELNNNTFTGNSAYSGGVACS